MAQSADITSTSGNSPAFSIPNGFQGLVLIQNESAQDIRFEFNQPATDASCVLKAAANGGVTTLTLPLCVLRETLDVFAWTSTGSVNLTYGLLPYVQAPQ